MAWVIVPIISGIRKSFLTVFVVVIIAHMCDSARSTPTRILTMRKIETHKILHRHHYCHSLCVNLGLAHIEKSYIIAKMDATAKQYKYFSEIGRMVFRVWFSSSH